MSKETLTRKNGNQLKTGLEQFICLVSKYAVPPCVAVTMPDFADDENRLDADTEKMFAFIRTGWDKRYKENPLYKNCVISNQSTAQAISEISKAHNHLLDLAADAAFSSPVDSDIVNEAFERYKALLNLYALERYSFYIEFLFEISNLLCYTGGGDWINKE